MKLRFRYGRKKIKQMKNILTYAEYQRKLKGLKTPEDVAAFAQELLAPALDTGRKDSAPKIVEQNSNDGQYVVEKPSVHTPNILRGKQYAVHQVESLDTAEKPWDDIVENSTEAMAISLYAKGLTTRDISNYLKNVHGVEIGQPSISAITDKVFPLIKEWQARPLSSCYPMVHLDGLRFKVRDSGKITSKIAYIAMGINQYGQKEILGIWVSEGEGSKFWMHILNELKNRGVDDILIACVDGLKGFPDAIKAIFPKTDVQVCVVHQIRHTVMFIAHKDREKFCEDLRVVYTSPTAESGMDALLKMEEQWPQYKPYLKTWEQRWMILFLSLTTLTQ